MVNRKRAFKKGIWLDDSEKARADRIKAMSEIPDHELYSRGLDNHIEEEYGKYNVESPYVRSATLQLPNMFRFKKRGGEDAYPYRKIVCENCKKTYETNRGRGTSWCPECGYGNKEMPGYQWKAPELGAVINPSTGKRVDESRFKFGKAKDDLVSEEYQGNVEQITESQRAMLFFNIPQDVWTALSEKEKLDYISRLPPKKTRAGGEELSDRDSALRAEHEQWAQDKRDFYENEMKLITQSREERRRKYRADRRR